jgi:hypothetical protein
MDRAVVRCPVIVVTGVLAMAAWPTASSAQQGWSTAADFLSAISTTGGTIYAPLVEVDAAGNAIALWTEPGLTGNGVGPIVRTARRSILAGSWSEPFTLASGPPSSNASDLGMDAAGNAVAVWSSSYISANRTVDAARFDASTGQWTPIAAGQRSIVASSGQVAMNAAGDVLLCVVENVSPGGVTCRSYVAATATWSTPQTVTSVFASTLDVEIDGAGNGIAVWLTSNGVTVQAARFVAATSTWLSPVDLAAGLPSPGVPGPQLAMNDAGDAVATWTRGTALEASRLPAGASAWTPSATLSTPLSFANEAARAVVAPSGNVTVAWVQTGPGVRASLPRFVAVSRYDVTSATWTPMTIQGQSGFAYGPPAIDGDPQGNVHVMWSRSLASPGIRLLAARFTSATGQWTTVTDLSAVNQAAYNPDVAVDDRGNAIATWFQTAGGFSVPQSLRWAATPAPVTIIEVTPSAGTVAVGVGLLPGIDPALAPTTFEYSLDGGTSWVTRSPAGTSSPLVVSGLTDGVPVAFGVRAVNVAGVGAPSTLLQVRAGAAAAATPTNLRLVARAGNRLTFAWVAPATGFVPTGYEIEGGIAGQVLATVPTGGPATQFSVPAPDGTFFVRVVATAGALRSAPSNEIVVTVGGVSAPSPPENLLASKSGPTIVLSWTTVLDRGATTSTAITVSGPPSTLTALVPAGEWTSFPAIPGRTEYDVTVAAVNGGGASGPSNAVVVAASAACSGAPNPPRAFSASTQGGVVYLDWLPPATGEAVTSYVVSVTGAFTGSFMLPGRTLAAPVPSGSYTVRVSSVGPCGTSAPSAAQTIVVL